MKNKAQTAYCAGKSRRELRRGEGSSLCNLGDGDEEPEAEGARCPEHREWAARQRARPGGLSPPSQSRPSTRGSRPEGPGAQPTQGLEEHAAVLQRTLLVAREREGSADEIAEEERSDVGE